MAERLCLDPTRENSANAPFELISPSDDAIVGLILHDYPSPPLTVQWASSVDTSGSLPASRKYENRSIALSVEIADPGLAAATNKATNPKAAVDTTGWTNNSLTLMERQTTLPARLDPFDTAIHATGNADDDAAYLSASVTNAVAETFTAWVYVVSGTVRLEVWNATPALNTNSANITAGSWQQIVLPYTPTTTATYTFRVAQNGAGTCEFYVTGMQIGPTYPYLDGDTPGASWSGTRNASSSNRPAGETRLNAAVWQLQAKVAKIAREGGTLRRVLNSGTPVTYDLLAGDSFGVTFDYVYIAGLAQVQISLTAAPEGRGDDIQQSDRVETTLPVLNWTETGIKGDLTAKSSLLLDNDAASTLYRAVAWGLRSRYYSSAATAKLYYEAEACTHASAAAGPAGASGAGSNTAFHQNVGTTLSESFTLGSGTQTHIGGYRMFARVQLPNTNTGIVQVRLSWVPKLGTIDGITNDWVSIVDNAGAAVEAEWVTLDLGPVNIPVTNVGPQGWEAIVYAKSSVATDDIYYDFVTLIPTEQFGLLVDTSTGGLQYWDAADQLYIRTDGVWLESALSASDGYFVRPATYEGDYLTVPPAGAEGRTTEFIIHPLGSTYGGSSGTNVYRGASFDDLSGRLTYSPRYLVAPGP